jgi:hypothetical protein
LCENLVTLENIGFELELGRVTDQAGIAINDDLANILLLAHQQAHLPAMLPGAEFATKRDASWNLRNPLRYRR